MLETINVKYRYAGGSVLDFPDITCGTREHTLLLGNSGCGKTTLLNLIAGLRRPMKGAQILVDSENIAKMSNTALDTFRGQNIGLVFQSSHFINALNVAENIGMAQKLSGDQVDLRRIEGVLDALGISDKSKRKPYQLSQGEQQRVAIARAVINNPKLILADEPTAALDDVNTNKVINLLIEQADKANATLLVVTHDQRLKDEFSKRIEL